MAREFEISDADERVQTFFMSNPSMSYHLEGTVEPRLVRRAFEVMAFEEQHALSSFSEETPFVTAHTSIDQRCSAIGAGICARTGGAISDCDVFRNRVQVSVGQGSRG